MVISLLFLVLLSLGILLILLMQCFMENQYEEHAFCLQTDPPISDQEYLNRFDWDVDPDVALKVRKIVSEISGVDENLIYPEARLVEDLGME